MPVQEELDALRRAREAIRRIVTGQRQSIRRPGEGVAQTQERSEGRGQAQAPAG